MQKGGPLMWLLLFCSILAGALFLERALFFHQISVRVGEFLGGLSNLIRHHRWAEAQMECAAFPTPVTRVLHAAILHHNAPREELKTIVQEAGQLEVPRLERRLGLLGAIGLIAPLIGLLGTVIGMIDVFGNISAQSGFANSSEISGGIYQSLLTTAGGLFVAIPAALGYAFLSSRLNSILHEMERAGIEVVNLITDSRQPGRIIEFETPERSSRSNSES
jgi:biopolymer transport protein ExbB